jgi:histidine ammonia-lyase
MSPGAAAGIIPIVPGSVTLSTLRRIARGNSGIELGPAAWDDVEACHDLLDRALVEGRTIYGVNTGFGKLAGTRIGEADLATLQRNLILSHCSGSGPEFCEEVIRLVLALKVMGLGRGHSGVRRVIIEMLRDLLVHEVYPCVPAKGSVGAPSHAACAPVGNPDRRRRATHGGRRPLRPKGSPSPVTSLSRSDPRLCADQRHRCRPRSPSVDCGAPGCLRGGARRRGTFAEATRKPHSIRRAHHAVRGHQGQTDVAAAYRELLEGRILAARVTRASDPYSLRCQPQVMARCRDAPLPRARSRSANARTTRTSSPQKGCHFRGNFHAELVATVDVLAIALAEMALSPSGGSPRRRGEGLAVSGGVERP